MRVEGRGVREVLSFQQVGIKGFPASLSVTKRGRTGLLIFRSRKGLGSSRKGRHRAL